MQEDILQKMSVTSKMLKKINNQVLKEIEDAVEFAENDPPPDHKTLERDLFKSEPKVSLH